MSFFALVTAFALCSANGAAQSRSAHDLEGQIDSTETSSTAADEPAATANVSARQERVRRFLAQRAVAGTEVSPAAARQVSKAEHAALSAKRASRPVAHLQGTASLSAPWTPLGPSALITARYGAVTGRVTALALDPNDSSGNTLYVGTTGGGVWKSTNAAGPLASMSFAPLTDTLAAFSANAGSSNLPSLSIGALAVQPAPNPVLLAGTGDPNDATDSLYGEGILRSTDGGLTWTVVNTSRDGANGNHSFSGLATAGMAWSTATPSLVVAALSTSLAGIVVGASGSYSIPGLYYSSDAGQTWQMASVYDGAQVVQQPTATQSSGVPASAVVWNAQRRRFYAAVRGHGYYSSADGRTWSRLAQQPGTGLTTASCPALTYSPRCPIFRGALAVQPASGDMYALTVDASNADQGVWQDLCVAGQSGACSNAAPTWGARVDGGALEAGGSGSGATTVAQGDYNLALAAIPQVNGGTLLFAGTVDLYRCSLAAGASSCTMRNTTNARNGCNAPAAVAPSQHALAATSLTVGGPLLFVGNDGGLWRSGDGVAQTGAACAATDADHFDNLNSALGAGGSLAEIVGFAQDPEAAGTLLAGVGALGSGATSAASSLQPWLQLAAGEGGMPLLDPGAPNNWTLTIGAGINLKQCNGGGSCGTSDFSSPATIGASQVSNDAALLDAPVLLDPALSSQVLLGTCRVWRGPAGNGSAWGTGNALSTAFSNAGTPCSASSPLIRSLAAGGTVATSGNLGSSVLYAGMAGMLDGGSTLGGHVFMTKSANTASSSTKWTDVASGQVTNDAANGGTFNPWGFDVSSLAVDPHDATGATVYATVMGFGGSPHLYQSNDFGAHWLNISSNLPSAPANAVVVDPNDANTVYVAMDTGVYVAQAVNNCSSTNCWSVLGSSLPNAPVVTLAVAADLPTGDGRTGMLRAGTYGRGLWQMPLLTASNTLHPAISLSATSFNFAVRQVATASETQTLTITSSGSAPVTFGALAVSGDFVETDTCAGQTVAVGSSCTVSLQFAPSATGTRVGLLTVYANIPGGQATASLIGSGSAPAAVVLTPLSLTFPATTVSAAAAAQIITISNTGGNAATLGAPVVTGDFSLVANTCGLTLAAQTGCSVSVLFRPTGSGKRSGTFTMTDSAGVQTAQLTGTGNSPATDTLSPGALSFAQQAIGTASATQQLTLTNTGEVALTLISAAVSAGDFSVVNACGNSLAAHSSCAINVSFVPTTVGARTGSMTVTDQFRVQAITLAGIAVAPAGVSLSPASLTFSAAGVGTLAASQTLTLTNNGGLPLNLKQTTLSGSDFSLLATTCGVSVDPGTACTFVIGFMPTGAGSRQGSLTLSDDAGSGTQVASLTGTGVDFTITPSGPTSLTVASGSIATFPMVVSSASGLSGTVNLTCSGAPAHSTCTVFPAAAALGQAVAVSVTVQTGLTTALLQQPLRTSPWSRRGEMLASLAACLPLWLCSRRLRRHHAQVLWRLKAAGGLAALLCCLTLLGGGCGAARTIPLSGGTGTTALTPAGTYGITATGTTTGIAHTANLSLVVQ